MTFSLRIRSMGVVRAALLPLLFLSFPIIGSAGTKYALIIGTNKYLSVGQIRDLTYPEKDVDDLKAALEYQGFSVTALKGNLAHRGLIIRELTRFAKQLHKDDMFLLEFSGHGVRNEPVNKETYWLTYGTQLDALDVEGIRLKHLLDYVQDIPASRKLVLLDHCFSGNITLGTSGSGGGDLEAGSPAAPGGARGGAGEPGLDQRGQTLDLAFPEEKPNQPGGLVLLAASYGLALESPSWGHGVFTKAVLEAIDEFKADQPAYHGDGDGKVSVAELIAFVEKEVPILAEQNHVRQFVVPKQTGDSRGLPEWFIAEHTRGQAGAQQEIPGFQEALRQWRYKNWMSATVYSTCSNLLEDVKESARTNVSLTPDQERKFLMIREAMMDQNHTERERARSLDIFFREP